MEILGYIFGFLLIVFGLFFWGVVLYRTLHSDGDAPLIKTEIEIPEKITITIHIEKESEESEGAHEQADDTSRGDAEEHAQGAGED